MDYENDVYKFMADHGISQAELSRMFGIPYRTVQDWIAGRRHPPSYIFQLLYLSLLWSYGITEQ